MERPTEFDNLVHQYPLGSDVIRTSEGGVCLYKVYKNEYTSSNGESAAFSLTIRRINYNGQIFGWEHSRLVIPNFTGLRSACELDPSPFPVYENTDGAVIKNSLEQRGQHFENLKDIHCGMYSGPFILAGSSTMLNRKEAIEKRKDHDRRRSVSAIRKSRRIGPTPPRRVRAYISGCRQGNTRLA
ncbi:hypothetical protein FSST1_002478 [Fusarium sambucinum]